LWCSIRFCRLVSFCHSLSHCQCFLCKHIEIVAWSLFLFHAVSFLQHGFPVPQKHIPFLPLYHVTSSFQLFSTNTQNIALYGLILSKKIQELENEDTWFQATFSCLKFSIFHQTTNVSYGLGLFWTSYVKS
jgi:hypothetical protein